jgi:uncharacterized membrane protein YccC
MPATPRTDDAGYDPPASAEENPWYVLSLKVGLATMLGYLVARACGFEDPTWSVLAAAFLATSSPIASVGSALRKSLALLVGAALGAFGAISAAWLSGVPALHIALVGLTAGLLASRSSDYLFAAVVGTVVTFAASGGGDPIAEVVVTTICMVLIGCVVGPAVVWCVERVRKAWTERSA